MTVSPQMEFSAKAGKSSMYRTYPSEFSRPTTRPACTSLFMPSRLVFQPPDIGVTVLPPTVTGNKPSNFEIRSAVHVDHPSPDDGRRNAAFELPAVKRRILRLRTHPGDHR